MSLESENDEPSGPDDFFETDDDFTTDDDELR